MSQTPENPSIDPTEQQYLHQLRAGDLSVLGQVFDENRDRLWRTVSFRLDRRLLGRVDADDILQEAYLDATQRVHHFVDNPKTTLFLWIRQIVAQTLIDVHRRHLGVQMRDANREMSIHRGGFPQATSVSLAAHLIGGATSPSQAAIREETAIQLEQAIEEMEPIDQEVLALRHFEELSNSEVAQVLQIQPKAASIRYVRAIARLKKLLQKLPGFFEGES